MDPTVVTPTALGTCWANCPANPLWIGSAVDRLAPILSRLPDAWRIGAFILLAVVFLRYLPTLRRGEAAVKMCRELSPKIVFMDLRMPGIGGVEACRQIRAASADTRLVLLSASLREAPEDLMSSGAARIMTKDELLVPDRIRALVQQLME
jgi:CheY-like chemotaxis protein